MFLPAPGHGLQRSDMHRQNKKLDCPELLKEKRGRIYYFYFLS
jgi:hypothetical protein